MRATEAAVIGSTHRRSASIRPSQARLIRGSARGSPRGSPLPRILPIYATAVLFLRRTWRHGFWLLIRLRNPTEESTGDCGDTCMGRSAVVGEYHPTGSVGDRHGVGVLRRTRGSAA